MNRIKYTNTLCFVGGSAPCLLTSNAFLYTTSREIKNYVELETKLKLKNYIQFLVQLIEPFLTCEKQRIFHIIAKIFYVLSIL